MLNNPVQREQFREARRLERKIHVNVPLPPQALQPNGLSHTQYPSNAVSTAKYNLATFIPKNIYEQFRGLANIYFLLTVLVQLVPGVQSIPIGVAMIPLAFILVLTGIKDAVEDYRRHCTDNTLNESVVWTLNGAVNTNYPVKKSSWVSCFALFRRNQHRNKQAEHCTCIKPQHDMQLGACMQCTRIIKPTILNAFKQKKWQENRKNAPQTSTFSMAGWGQSRWKDLRVGDYVLLKGGDSIPADLLVLSTSERGGICYVETKNLDGETNLKIRDSVKSTTHITTANECTGLKMLIETELPYPDLFVQNGILRLSSEDCTSFNIRHVLLRGSVLRNTDFVIGCVLYTGVDTKVVLNSGVTPSKRSKIDRMMNPIVIVNVVVLLAICLMNGIVEGYLYQKWAAESAPWLTKVDNTTFILSTLENFGASFVMLQNLVPISLYLTIEAVKTFQAYFIHADIDMYHAESESACVPKTWSISDDLGQIDYIFSDKTGTLTENKMDFKKCSINGKSYGRGYTDISRFASDDGLTPVERAVLEEKIEHETRNHAFEFYANPFISNQPLSFIDTQIFKDLNERTVQSEAILGFFLLLASCHTVLSPKRDPQDKNRLLYPAQSPDEEALVKVAKDMGVVFIERHSDRIIVDVHSKRREIRILNVLEFSSTRKRMSIIVQEEDGSLCLLTKGADNVIYDRLGQGHDEVKLATFTHLEEYATEGLRTLCLARRTLTMDEYELWDKQYQTANSSLNDREQQLEVVAELIERDLVLLGATAIEDKLQDKVPECIQTLREAGIKLWVLTGDKKETAINIGFAANIFSRDMNLICIDGQDPDTVHSQVREILFSYKSGDGLLALVIDGNSLRFALDYTEECKLDFIKLGIICRSVICCRVSPKQKAQVVCLMKAATGAMCLAIGDGANDCSMIQEAHIGVGIAGQEGLQAAMASDFVIAKFKFLTKLLLVHGHWSYYRIGEMILNFFFKNVVWVAVLVYYQLFSGFSSNLLYNYSYVLLYNLLFTVFPSVFLGVFDQDVSARYLLAYPQLYRSNINKRIFTYHKLAYFMIDAIFQSAVCFFIMWCQDESFISPDGYTMDKESLGTAVAIVGVMIANYYIGFSIKSWTWIVAIVVLLSTFSITLWIPFLNVLNTDAVVNTLTGIEKTLMRDLAYWATVILTLVTCILPRFILVYIQSAYFPTDIDVIREEQALSSEPLITKRGPISSFTSAKSFRVKSELWDVEMNYYLERQGTSPSIVGCGVLDMRTNTRRSHHGYAFSGSEGERENVERILGLSGRERNDETEAMCGATKSGSESSSTVDDFRSRRYGRARKRTTSADRRK